MLIDGKYYQSIWLDENDKGKVMVIDQQKLPFFFETKYGTVTAPVYFAHEKGIPVHVWVDETRPKNQGARLTAWELGKQGVPFVTGLITEKGVCRADEKSIKKLFSDKFK